MGMSVDLGFRDSANRNVIYWGSKVVTTGDRHLPYSLDPRTLDTIGKDDFGGVLKLNDFASRFRIDHKKNRLCGFAIKPSAGKALQQKTHQLKWGSRELHCIFLFKEI